jgi:hypothetical protein
VDKVTVALKSPTIYRSRTACQAAVKVPANAILFVSETRHNRGVCRWYR